MQGSLFGAKPYTFLLSEKGIIQRLKAFEYLEAIFLLQLNGSLYLFALSKGFNLLED
jgi:hypothetical protein